MKTYILNITVPAKNKKYYEKVVLNLYPLIFKREDVINFILKTVKTKKLYEDGTVHIRDITDINNVIDETINLPDLIPEDEMIFDEEIF